ncbi:hypothetical protein P9A44_gp69 [Xanthomonas phage vB_Xar_IVIA-DoCa5]|uniref:Uncharacterized protein n=1 Tax=Xanthomonas phage vB_Xar_IVIA-DoCa5 TaxID=2975532 RepID=A0A9X9NYT4_9CAUD|nr:hypothetical protein P9A44_gp69 [Xanthomonas phage vB_Xar_IVIA-DoCa5]UYA98739.1 hypothetical protein IVIADoCa5_69 [Xanthomonas phage vB_Xar_IVIA-DoCa5]
MDVNEYMSKSLSLLERIAEGIEALNEQGVHVTNFHLPEGTELKAVGEVVHATPADKKEEAKADKKETKTETKKVEEKKEEPAKTTAKRATADDARKALKAYAAIEGNDAAMELLTSLGGASVSALAEASTDEDDKLAELIAKCGG